MGDLSRGFRVTLRLHWDHGEESRNYYIEKQAGDLGKDVGFECLFLKFGFELRV